MLAINDNETGEAYIYGGSPLRGGKNRRNKFFGFSRRFQWTGMAPQDVDGLLILNIPPGKYDITVGKGIEFSPVKKTINLEPRKTGTVNITLKRFANLPAEGWWAGDDHFHLARFDDEMNDERKFGPATEPLDVVNKQILVSAGAEDIAMVNCLQMGSILGGDGFAQFAFGEAGRVYAKDQAIVSGQEEPRTGVLGHTISLNTQSYIRDVDRYHQYDVIFEEARRQGGTTGYAHVHGYENTADGGLNDFEGKSVHSGDDSGQWSRFSCDWGLAVDVPEGLVDFFELLDNNNFLRPQIYYDFLNMGFKITASAGSDFPWGAHLGDQRVYVYTGKGEPFNPDKWFENHKKGHTFITQGPLIEFTVDGAIPGETIECNAGEKAVVKAKAFGHPEIGAPKKVALIKFGKHIETIESTDPNRESLEAQWDIPIERSCWLALLVEAHNGAMALTSPVYIEVDGQPTLDPSQLREIVERRLMRIAMQRESIAYQVSVFEDFGGPVAPRKGTVLTKEQTTKLLVQQNGGQWAEDREAHAARLDRAEAYYKNLLKYAER